MVFKYDFLIIGAGVAGMSYALKVARAHKCKVFMICKTSLDEANTSFAKSNLTTTGLASKESDYGDYFAWGATEPWYSSISGSTFTWKKDHTSGYASGTAPTFNGKYDGIKDFEMADDPARQILDGDWQIPTHGQLHLWMSNQVDT